MYNGHISGRVIRTLDRKLPYKVVMLPAVCPGTEPTFATMREAEEFIRRNTPAPARALSDLYDRTADES
ncbi:MAG: hypothetical protein JO254_08750 [Pseudolabrys sp.]|nr:hypothetical protein [Pseudolabrys sp.]